MKKTIALTQLAAAATVASAQGTVTVSGVADAAVRNVKNQGAASSTSMVSGSNSTSRLVVRGNEDLGGGLGAGEIKASYNQADLSGTVGSANIGGNDASQIGLGYVHNLSKRTAVYGTFARIDNDGAATFSVPGAGAAVAGKTSTGYEFGIRHSF